MPALAKTVLSVDLERFVPEASLRPVGELLDALDTTFCLHWVTTEASVRKVQPPAGLEPGVISERHHALNWLTRFEDADWDEVTTPT